MTTSYINEDVVEQLAMEQLRDILRYETRSGPDIAPDGASPERDSYRRVVLLERLRTALIRINPDISKCIGTAGIFIDRISLARVIGSLYIFIIEESFGIFKSRRSRFAFGLQFFKKLVPFIEINNRCVPT